MAVTRYRAVVFREWGPRVGASSAARSFLLEWAQRGEAAGGQVAAAFTSTAVGDLVSWSVDANGHVFPAHGGAADEPYPHVVVDRAGIEWTVREVETPQPWARAARCLVLNSRECVRRVWRYPSEWRGLDADQLLKLDVVD